MSLPLHFFRQIREMFFLALVLAMPFLLVLLYTGMRVETALLRRDIRSAISSRDTLVKKNRALRNEVAELSGSSLERLYWKRHGLLPFYVKNRVVNLKLEREGQGTETAANLEN